MSNIYMDNLIGELVTVYCDHVDDYVEAEVIGCDSDYAEMVCPECDVAHYKRIYWEE